MWEQSEEFSSQEMRLFRAMALLASLVELKPCSAEEAARFTDEDILSVYKVLPLRCFVGST